MEFVKDLQSDILLELHVPDFEIAKKFYGNIGYEVVWEKAPHDEDGYLVMRSGNSILNFTVVMSKFTSTHFLNASVKTRLEAMGLK